MNDSGHGPEISRGPPNGKGWFRRHKIITSLGVLAGVFALAGVAAGVSGGGSTPQPGQHQAQPAATASTPTAAPAAATPELHVTRVHFIVTGTGNPSITYGSDSDNRDGGGTLGILGDGNQLPWKASMRFRGDAQYYSMDAQLEGGGDIHCKIVVTGPGIKALTVSSGHASGGSNICSVQAAPNDPRGSSWQNEQ
jgi:hypothetical protein